MAGVNHDRQMGQLFQNRNGTQIQCVSCSGFKGTNPSFAKDYVFVAACHDVFCAHQKLINRICKTSFQQNRLGHLADLLQQLEVLHISCANLHKINGFFKHGDVYRIHDFGNDGQTCQLLCFYQQLQTIALQTLECVGGGSGLECAATQQTCACRFDSFCDFTNLRFAFNGTGTCDNLEIAAADFYACNINYLICIMEFTVCIFEGLLNTLHIFNDIQRSDQIHIYHRGIANQTNDGMIHTTGNMGADAHAAKPYLQVFNLFFLCVGFQYYYHNFLLKKSFCLVFFCSCFTSFFVLHAFLI